MNNGSQRESFEADWYDADYWNGSGKKGYPAEYGPSSAPWRQLAHYWIRKINPKIVVDLGCGLGYLLHEFRKRGIVSGGYDFSPYAVEHAVTPVTQHDLREPVEWNLAQPPDICFCLDVLEHLSPGDLELVMITLSELRPKLLVIHAGLAGTEDENEASHVTLWSRQQWLDFFADNTFIPAVLTEEQLAQFHNHNAILTLRQDGEKRDLQETYRQWIVNWGPVGRFWAERAFVLCKKPVIYTEFESVAGWTKHPHLAANTEFIG